MQRRDGHGDRCKDAVTHTITGLNARQLPARPFGVIVLFRLAKRIGVLILTAATSLRTHHRHLRRHRRTQLPLQRGLRLSNLSNLS